MDTQTTKNERIDIRVTPEEKRVFHLAYKISGDRTFSSFVTRIIKSRSLEIIQENERILASERDKKIFFDTIFLDQEPNHVLKDAAEKFKSSID